MENFYKKIGVFIAVVFALGFGFVAIRGSVDAETGKEFADALSVLPFSGAMLHWLQSFLPIDPAIFNIHQGQPFIMQLLILLVQTALLSPILLAINNTMGPILFRPHGNEYSIAGDWNAGRTKDKILRRLGKLLLITIIVPFVAFLSGYVLDLLFDWVNGLMIVWKVLIYIVAFALVALVAAIPILRNSTRRYYLQFAGNILQRILYVLITDVIIVATVGLLVAGVSGWDFMAALLVLFFWMTFYSDTDGFLNKRRIYRRV